MENFNQMLSKTPSWVWVVLALLVVHGVRAFKDRTSTISKVAVPPVLFTLFSLYSAHEAFKLDATVVGIWVVAWVAGIAAAMSVFKGSPISVADRDRKLLMLPGSHRVLILTLIIFASRYALAYLMVFDPQLLTATVPEMLLLGTIAGCSGFFVGKLISCLQVLGKTA